jgi:hypothetical protein
MRIKPVVIGVALLGALAFGVVSASADQTFKSGLYRNQPYTCAGGSNIDPSGQSFGTFAVTETHNVQLVQASVTVDNVKPYLEYHVFVTEAGYKCGLSGWQGSWGGGFWVSPPPSQLLDQYPYQVAEFWADGKGKGTVSFTFWAHTGETSAWVTVKHGNVMTVRSAAVPINR